MPCLCTTTGLVHGTAPTLTAIGVSLPENFVPDNTGSFGMQMRDIFIKKNLVERDRM